MRRWWLVGLLIAGGCGAWAQERLDDKDQARVMQSLKQDAQPLRQSLPKTLNNARLLADTFAKQAGETLETMKHGRPAQTAVKAMVDTAAQLDPLIVGTQVDEATRARWEKIRGELGRVAQAYGVDQPYLTHPGDTSSAGTCLNSVGIARSRQLVNECLQVSPATHPPCNARNACSLIVEEIKRGCALMTTGVPGFCSEFR